MGEKHLFRPISSVIDYLRCYFCLLGQDGKQALFSIVLIVQFCPVLVVPHEQPSRAQDASPLTGHRYTSCLDFFGEKKGFSRSSCIDSR